VERWGHEGTPKVKEINIHKQIERKLRVGRQEES